MIEGLSHLLTIRRNGNRPHSVMLTIDGQYRAPKYENDFKPMELVLHEPVTGDDFRAFKGLDVILCLGKWSKTATDALQKLKQYAGKVSVLSTDYGDDIGFVWTPAYGDVDFKDFKWVCQFNDAKNSICRTDKEVKERLRLEAEAKQHLPNVEDYRG